MTNIFFLSLLITPMSTDFGVRYYEGDGYVATVASSAKSARITLQSIKDGSVLDSAKDRVPGEKWSEDDDSLSIYISGKKRDLKLVGSWGGTPENRYSLVSKIPEPILIGKISAELKLLSNRDFKRFLELNGKNIQLNTAGKKNSYATASDMGEYICPTLSNTFAHLPARVPSVASHELMLGAGLVWFRGDGSVKIINVTGCD